MAGTYSVGETKTRPGVYHRRITKTDDVVPVQTSFRYLAGVIPYCRRKAAVNWLAP